MTSLKHGLAVVSLPLLLALSLSACGGSDEQGAGTGSKTGASTTDFCDAYSGLAHVTDGGGIQDLGNALASAGTPDGIADNERHGFEVFVNEASKVDPNADLNSLQDPDNVSAEDGKDVTAFITYATRTCAGSLGVPTDIPS